MIEKTHFMVEDGTLACGIPRGRNTTIFSDVTCLDCRGVPAEEVVHHPAHYNAHPSGVECITIVRHFTFNVGNVIKYCWRAGLKCNDATDSMEKRVEDLKKAAFYLADEIARLEKSSPP
jgi:hypothetical protein